MAFRTGTMDMVSSMTRKNNDASSQMMTSMEERTAKRSLTRLGLAVDKNTYIGRDIV
jgi:hypothetical protein